MIHWRPEWSRGYGRQELASDAVAAVIVTLMLVPQSLAYALLAGLPAETGLYASIVPLVLYAAFGSSRALAVGPVAVIALMTAQAVGRAADVTGVDPASAALTLALLSGVLLLGMGLLRLGFLANFLSHPVLTGFISASAVLIAVSQLRHVLGVEAGGHRLPEQILDLVRHLPATHIETLLLGAGSIALLAWARRGLGARLAAAGLAPRRADLAVKIAPVLVVLGGIGVVAVFGLDARGVRVVGAIPAALPPLEVPQLTADLLRVLLAPALLIALVGFVESVAVAQSLAARRRERISADRELLGLGAANLGAAFSGGFPVTGGFARSVVNFQAGAVSPVAGVLTAGLMALATVYLTPVLRLLPDAVLAATIIVAVLSLVDPRAFGRIWHHSRGDALALAATVLFVLLLGVEAGILAGVLTAVAVWLWRASRPHYAIVGLVPGTEHFRNVCRHRVVESPTVLTVRIDESLMFFNARWLEDLVNRLVGSRRELTDLVLMCPAVNMIDASGLESLERINASLKSAGIRLHLSEVKGPVMDRLQRGRFLQEMSGQVFLTQYQALAALDPDAARARAPLGRPDSGYA